MSDQGEHAEETGTKRRRKSHHNPGGTVIREARLRSFLTQQELAERMGVDQSIVSRWERGRQRPSFDSVAAAAAAADFSLQIEFLPVIRLAPVKSGSIILKRENRAYVEGNTARIKRILKTNRRRARRVQQGLPPDPPRKGPHV